MNNHIAFVNPNFSDQSKSIDEVNTWCKIELTWIMCNLCMADASLINSLFETDALGYNSILAIAQAKRTGPLKNLLKVRTTTHL